MLKRDEFKNLPNTTGVYLFYNNKKEVIYVGKALALKARVSSYFNKDEKSIKTIKLVLAISSIDYVEVASEVEALLLEASLIKKYKPKYNIALRDDKSFLYIAISKEEFPRVLAIRKNDNVKTKYKFGPFPSSTTVRSVLKLVRKLFPYCTQSPKSKKACFYWHIGLCNPCPAVIRKETGNKYNELKKAYLKNIRHIKDFMEGRLNTVVNLLTHEMYAYSKAEDFENAQRIHKIINHLEYVRKPYYKISSFLNDREFLKNELVYKTDELKKVLLPYYPNISNLSRIEGIDISNISGESAVASLVVFIQGQQDPSLYRRFKIKAQGPNDVGMIAEVLTRRLKNKQWDYPNLFIVDGGKPQVGAALSVLKNTGIPVIGLAKREETIIIPHKEGFISLWLTKDKGALHLMQKIRDESHRFAQKYHHLLRRKLITNSKVDIIGL